MLEWNRSTWMVDNLSRENRSKVMASIGGKNTHPELIVRKLVWASGKRYRIHNRTVFGTPDLSNKKRKVAIFIDGCFWHGCKKCYKEPRSNIEFWRRKLARNLQRRKEVTQLLKDSGWNILSFWEHEVLSDPQSVAAAICLKLWTKREARRSETTWEASLCLAKF